jgi:hypothetical protein
MPESKAENEKKAAEKTAEANNNQNQSDAPEKRDISGFVISATERMHAPKDKTKKELQVTDYLVMVNNSEEMTITVRGHMKDVQGGKAMFIDVQSFSTQNWAKSVAANNEMSEAESK